MAITALVNGCINLCQKCRHFEAYYRSMATQITPESATDHILAQLADTNQRLAETILQLADTNQRLTETNQRLTETNLQLADTNKRLAIVEMDVAVIKSNYATREDIAKLENTLLKWFIATAITLAGLSGSLAFLAARFIH